MKDMKPFAFFVLIFTLFTSCGQKFLNETVSGVYVPVGYVNTFDTLKLKGNGTYTRKLLDKSRQLAWEMEGHWFLENSNELKFRSFFVNLDRDLATYPDLVIDTTGGWSSILEMKNDTITFCLGYFDGENCYQKIK